MSLVTVKQIDFISVAKIFFSPKSRMTFMEIFFSIYKTFFSFAKMSKISLTSVSPSVCTDAIYNYLAGCRILLRRIQLQGWTGDSAHHLLFARW